MAEEFLEVAGVEMPAKITDEEADRILLDESERLLKTLHARVGMFLSELEQRRRRRPKL